MKNDDKCIKEAPWYGKELHKWFGYQQGLLSIWVFIFRDTHLSQSITYLGAIIMKMCMMVQCLSIE